MLNGCLHSILWNQPFAFLDELERLVVEAGQHVNLGEDCTSGNRLRVCFDDLLEVRDSFAFVAYDDVVERHNHLGVNGIGRIEHGLACKLRKLLGVFFRIAPVVEDGDIVDEGERVNGVFAIDLSGS